MKETHSCCLFEISQCFVEAKMIQVAQKSSLFKEAKLIAEEFSITITIRGQPKERWLTLVVRTEMTFIHDSVYFSYTCLYSERTKGPSSIRVFLKNNRYDQIF